MRKIFKRIWRNMVNLGFAVQKSSSNKQKVFTNIRRICGKNLCAYGEVAKRVFAYSPNMPRDTKLCITRLLMVQHEKR
jgi:hypothetical protein